jgi:hypothetical protein
MMSTGETVGVVVLLGIAYALGYIRGRIVEARNNPVIDEVGEGN